VLLVCIGSHVSELLDTWDQTFQTGNDIESTLVVLALTVGVALALASAAVVLFSTTKSFNLVNAAHSFPQGVSELIISTHSPPIVPLRI
jgi:hypothetical protein